MEDSDDDQEIGITSEFPETIRKTESQQVSHPRGHEEGTFIELKQGLYVDKLQEMRNDV